MSQTENYRNAYSRASLEPRYVLAVSFDDADTDISYFTSHTDCQVPPGTAAADRFDSTISAKGLQATTQRVKPVIAQHTIGGATIRLLDIDGDITQRIHDKLTGGEGLRKKRVVLYGGEVNLTDWADYWQIFTFYIDKNISYQDGVYTISASDVQRLAKVDIFDAHVGVLTSDITATATAIPVTIVDPATKFPLVAHDALYSSRPSETVGYIKIDNEWICHSGWDGNNENLTVVQRGALNTRAAAHEAGSSSDDRKNEVTEQVYLEMPAVKLIYALLTGELHDQSAQLPVHWHAGLATAQVKLDDLTGIGTDLWDPANNSGRMVRFIGIEKTKAKQFVEKELCLWAGVFLPVLNDGRYGLRRFRSVLPFAEYNEVVTEPEIVKYGALNYDQADVLNDISIDYNWLDSSERFNRSLRVVNTNSIAKHGLIESKRYQFRGAFQGLHGDDALRSFARFIAIRHGHPPIKHSVTLQPKWARLEVGDIFRLVNQHVIDYHNNQTLDRSLEVQGKKVDWLTGLVTFDLFGGIDPPVEEPHSESGSLMSSYYQEGTDLASVLTISGSGVVTEDATLTGNADRSAAIYHYGGDLTIGAGVTIDWTDNIELRIDGDLIINGTLTGDGAGLAGAASSSNLVGDKGIQGAVGAVGENSGVLLYRYSSVDGGIATRQKGTLFGPAFGIPSLGSLDISNADGSSLDGIPLDLRGSSGSAGNAASYINANTTTEITSAAVGGDGGDGGGGILIVSRGAGFGVNGELSSRGGGSTAGDTFGISNVVLHGGPGVGGSGGAVIWLIDGDGLLPDKNNITINSGAVAAPSASVDKTVPVGTTFVTNTISDFVGNFDPDVELGTGLQGHHIFMDGGESVAVDSLYPGRDQLAGNLFLGYVPAALNGYTWFPADEDARAVNAGYGGNVDWAEITDLEGGRPEDNATANLIPAGINTGGSTSIAIVKNANANGTANDGEIQIQSGVYFLPGGTKRVVDVNKRLATPYEGVILLPPDNVFYIVSGAATVASRFAGLSALINEAGDDGFFVATYNRVTSQWSAVDNDNNTEDFTPLDTDFVFAVATKTSASNGIDTLVLVPARVNDPEATFNDLSSAAANNASLVFNPDATVVAADGRPAGVKAVYGSATKSNISYQDPAKTIVKVHHPTDTSIGAGWPAFRVSPGQSYRIFIRIKSDVASSNGFFFRLQELDTELPVGVTHVSHGSNESGVIEDTREVQAFRENAAIGTSWEEHEFIYTPTPTARWASPVFLNWTNMGTSELHIDKCLVVPNQIDTPGLVTGSVTQDVSVTLALSETTHSIASGGDQEVIVATATLETSSDSYVLLSFPVDYDITHTGSTNRLMECQLQVRRDGGSWTTLFAATTAARSTGATQGFFGDQIHFIDNPGNETTDYRIRLYFSELSSSAPTATFEYEAGLFRVQEFRR